MLSISFMMAYIKADFPDPILPIMKVNLLFFTYKSSTYN